VADRAAPLRWRGPQDAHVAHGCASTTIVHRRGSTVGVSWCLQVRARPRHPPAEVTRARPASPPFGTMPRMGSTTSASLDEFYDDYERIEAAFQDALDESLHPRGPDVLYDVVDKLGLPSGASVVDIGCGQGQHALELAQRFGFAVRGVDPVRRHIELANEAQHNAAKQHPELSKLVRFELGAAESLPIEAASVDLIWCREALYYFDLDNALAECRRVLRAGGYMVNGDRLEPREAARTWTGQATVPANADHNYVEAALGAAGFQIDECIELTSEGGERAQEERGEPGRRLLHAARLLRAPERYIAQFGRTAYDIMLGDCFWHIYRMIGKLSARLYVLKAPTSPEAARQA
jgi:SAM-dependent methyltransferase